MIWIISSNCVLRISIYFIDQCHIAVYTHDWNQAIIRTQPNLSSLNVLNKLTNSRDSVSLQNIVLIPYLMQAKNAKIGIPPYHLLNREKSMPHMYLKLVPLDAGLILIIFQGENITKQL